MQSLVKGKLTYRVFVGNFNSKKEAENFRHRMAIEGYVREFKEFAK
jgi:cell division protein FtsN